MVLLRPGVIIPFQFRDDKKLLMVGMPEEDRDLSIWDVKNVVRAAFNVYEFEFRNKKIGFNIPEELLLHYLGQRRDLSNFVIEIGQVYDPLKQNFGTASGECGSCRCATAAAMSARADGSLESAGGNSGVLALGAHGFIHLPGGGSGGGSHQHHERSQSVYSVATNGSTPPLAAHCGADEELSATTAAHLDATDTSGSPTIARMRLAAAAQHHHGSLMMAAAAAVAVAASSTTADSGGALLDVDDCEPKMDFEDEPSGRCTPPTAGNNHESTAAAATTSMALMKQQHQQHKQEQEHYERMQHEFYLQQQQQHQQHHHLEALFQQETNLSGSPLGGGTGTAATGAGGGSNSNFRQRKERMSKRQKEVYVNFLEQNPEINEHRRNDPFIDRHWLQLSEILNLVPQGAVKHVAEWKQTFDNWRYRVFLYARYNSRLSGEAALNPKSFKPLTNTDKRAYSIWIRNPDTAPPDLDKMRNVFANLDETLPE